MILSPAILALVSPKLRAPKIGSAYEIIITQDQKINNLCRQNQYLPLTHLCSDLVS